MFSCFTKGKNILLRKVYLLARCLMLNWGKRLYLPQKREIYGFFYSLSRKNI